MSLRKRKGQEYGDGPRDIQTLLESYSKSNSYVATRFATPTCACKGSTKKKQVSRSRASQPSTFRLAVDDDVGAAVRTCTACAKEHPIADSADYLADADLEECECPCGGDAFELVIGVALYRGSDDVRWFYIGCRCPACGLVGCYADWKDE